MNCPYCGAGSEYLVTETKDYGDPENTYLETYCRGCGTVIEAVEDDDDLEQTMRAADEYSNFGQDDPAEADNDNLEV